MIAPEEFARMHQKSFRVAFDFLAFHFPPGADPEWWDGVSCDLREAAEQGGGGPLVTSLLAGVVDYLDFEWKRRRRENGETDD